MLVSFEVQSDPTPHPRHAKSNPVQDSGTELAPSDPPGKLFPSACPFSSASKQKNQNRAFQITTALARAHSGRHHDVASGSLPSGPAQRQRPTRSRGAPSRRRLVAARGRATAAAAANRLRIRRCRGSAGTRWRRGCSPRPSRSTPAAAAQPRGSPARSASNGLTRSVKARSRGRGVRSLNPLPSPSAGGAALPAGEGGWGPARRRGALSEDREGTGV